MQSGLRRLRPPRPGERDLPPGRHRSAHPSGTGTAQGRGSAGCAAGTTTARPHAGGTTGAPGGCARGSCDRDPAARTGTLRRQGCRRPRARPVVRLRRTPNRCRVSLPMRFRDAAICAFILGLTVWPPRPVSTWWHFFRGQFRSRQLAVSYGSGAFVRSLQAARSRAFGVPRLRPRKQNHHLDGQTGRASSASSGHGPAFGTCRSWLPHRDLLRPSARDN